MSKDCIKNCPRIHELANEAEGSTVLSALTGLAIGAGLVNPFDSPTEKLLDACYDTYDCPGPRTEPAEVRTGIFGGSRGIETIDQTVCGLPPESDYGQ